jgi:hypothetical protein
VATVDKNFIIKNGLNVGSTINAIASTASLAPLRIPHGTAPSSPTNGDLWTTTSGIFARINGSTVDLGGAGSPANPSAEGILYGRTNITIYSDTALGRGAGQAQSAGAAVENTFIGYYAGADLMTGSYNVFLGSTAGMTTGMTPVALNNGSNNIFIGYGAGPTSNNVSNQIVIGNPTNDRFRVPGLGIDWTSSTVPTAPQDIIPLDDLTNEFNGTSNRFVPKYQGSQVTISNPYRLLLTINGIIQYIDSPDYVWMSGISRRGFFVDNDGQLQFSEAVPAGSEFDARLMPGAVTTTRTRTYPFKALDILLGG